MKWDISFSSFQEFGPDCPENVNWNHTFPTGAYIVDIPLSALKGLINEGTVSLNPKNINRDVNRTKLNGVQAHSSAGKMHSPPWGIVGTDGKLGIHQGKHRFQYAYLAGILTIPVVMNEKDADTIAQRLGIQKYAMTP